MVSSPSCADFCPERPGSDSKRSTARATRKDLNAISGLALCAATGASSAHRIRACAMTPCVETKRRRLLTAPGASLSAPRSLQRHLQANLAVFILRLVVDDQKYPRRVELSARQQHLLDGRGSLLPQGGEVGIADRHVLVQGLTEKGRLGGRQLGLGLDARDRLRVLRLTAQVLCVELRQQLDLGRRIPLLEVGPLCRRLLAAL